MRKALCVGINYVNTNSELNGCVNDALDWTDALRARSYGVFDRLDSEATKANILDGLRWLVVDAKWGDRLVFTYSGHGTYIPDLSGDEVDGRDEALVSVDMRTITDDDIAAAIGTLRTGVRMTIVSDSCHSGTVSRFMAGPLSNSMTRGKGERPRFIDPSLVEIEPSLRKPRALSTILPASTPMLLSGCKDDEVSWDANIGGRYRGAMTAACLNTLAQSSSMADWHASTLVAITHPQTPQLTATRYQRSLRPLV